ncbi:hypothetical protein V1264_021307 [Littorina saxatilis]|uniref:Uncharacterized protein n=1 Tax=Littorina saxatilis TaxID=31220 RepID=A0AAN9AHX8_9CAEN
MIQPLPRQTLVLKRMVYRRQTLDFHIMVKGTTKQSKKQKNRKTKTNRKKKRQTDRQKTEKQDNSPWLDWENDCIPSPMDAHVTSTASTTATSTTSTNEGKTDQVQPLPIQQLYILSYREPSTLKH